MSHLITPPSGVMAAIEDGTAQILRKVEFYEYDGVTPWYPNSSTASRLIDGSVSIDSSRDERRTFELTLDNFDNGLKPNAHGGLWYDKVIKTYRGVSYVSEFGPTDWYTKLGEFVIDNISESNFPHTIKVVGRDYTKRCLLSKLVQPESFVAGTSIHDLITSLAANAGIYKIGMEPSTETLSTRMDFERGTVRWEIMKEAAHSINREIYFNSDGWLVWEPFADPALQGPNFTFQTGANGNLVSYDRSVNDSQLYNHIVIYGDPGEGEERLSYVGEAVNVEPSSPTRIERIGDRLFSYASTFFTDEEQCQALAESWLKIYSLESYELNFSSFVYPWLDAGIVASITEEDQQALDPTQFLLDSLTIPLGLGTMSASAKRVSIVRDLEGAV